MAIACQEFLKAQGVGGMAGTQQANVAYTLRQQLRAAEDEGAHQDLAQLSICLHRREEIVAAELDPRRTASPGVAPATGARREC